jgi:hypothetical protein
MANLEVIMACNSGGVFLCIIPTTRRVLRSGGTLFYSTSGEIIGGTVDDTISNGLLDISVPPHSAEIYEIEWE